MRLQQQRTQFNIGKVPKHGIPSHVARVYIHDYRELENIAGIKKMEGGALLDNIDYAIRMGERAYEGYQQGKEVFKKVRDAYASDIGTTLKNMIPPSDSSARPGFPGERHVVLKLPNGRMGIANYCGPGTELIKRLERGDPGRTMTDLVCKKHDIDYALSRTPADVRKSDQRMLDTINIIKNNKLDSKFNTVAGKLIAGKMKGEDIGIFKPGSWAGDLARTKYSPEDNKLLAESNQELEQMGFGLPADKLKMKVLQQHMKGKRAMSEKKGQGKPRKRTVADFKPGYVMFGKGIELMKKDNLKKYVVNKMIPDIIKAVGIKPNLLTKSLIDKVVSKGMSLAKSNKVADIAVALTKTIMPMLIHSAKRMPGNGVRKTIKKTGKAMKLLTARLAKGIVDNLKHVANKIMLGKGKKQPFKNMNGNGNFWKSFASGFKKGFVGAANVVGPLASIVAPEIGVPLTVAGKLVDKIPV